MSTLSAAIDIMGSVLVRTWLDTPLYEFEDQTPNEVIRRVGGHRVVEQIATILGTDLDSPLPELSNRIPSQVYREEHGDVKVFEAMLDRFSRVLVRSWCEQSLEVFQGRTANEMMREEEGERQVIEHIAGLAEQHGIPTDSFRPSVA